MTDFTSLVAYSLRFDASFNSFDCAEYTSYFNDWVKIYFVKWMFAMERKKDGTEHFQGIVWAPHEIKDNALNLCRSQIKRKLVAKIHQDKKGCYSFVKARNPTGLAKYCNDKEGLGMVTNLTLREREMIGKWEDTEDRKKGKKQKWEKALEEMTDSATLAGHIADKQDPVTWTHSIIKLYSGIYGTMPRHAQVENWLYQYKADDKLKEVIRRNRYSKVFEMLYNYDYNQYEHPEQESLSF